MHTSQYSNTSYQIREQYAYYAQQQSMDTTRIMHITTRMNTTTRRVCIQYAKYEYYAQLLYVVSILNTTLEYEYELVLFILIKLSKYAFFRTTVLASYYAYSMHTMHWSQYLVLLQWYAYLLRTIGLCILHAQYYAYIYHGYDQSTTTRVLLLQSMHIMIVCTYSSTTVVLLDTSTRVVLVEGMMQIKEQETFVNYF